MRAHRNPEKATGVEPAIVSVMQPTLIGGRGIELIPRVRAPKSTTDLY